MRRLRRMSAVVLVAAGLAGCTDGSSEDAADRSTSSTSSTSTSAAAGGGDLRDLHRVEPPVRQYLAAVNDGNVDAAMDLRCPDSQLDGSEDRDLWARQAARLVAATGPLRIGELEFRAPVERGASVLLTLEGFDGRIDLHVVEESGAVLLCGFRPVASFDVEAGLPAEPEDAGPTSVALADLFPEPIGPDFTEVENHQVDPRPEGDFADADEVWTVAWQHEGFGGVRLEAARFADNATAAAALGELLAGHASDSVQRFDAPAVPQAVGLRILAFAWLWVQPPSSGPYNDLMGVQLGDTVVTVEPGGLDPATQQDLARELLARMVANAAVGG